MTRGQLGVTVRYERVLTSEELDELMREAPQQVHWAPNQDGITAHWFEVDVTTQAGEVHNIGAFYVRSDTLEAGQQYAVSLAERMAAEFQARLRGGTP